MMKRKYESEVALNLYTSHKRFFPIEALDKINFEKNYHIYMILTKPRTFVDEKSLSFKGEELYVKLYKIENGEKKYFNKIKYPISKFLNESNCTVSSQYPYDKITFDLYNKETGYKISGKRNIDKIYIDAEFILNLVMEKIDFEVLYIGQSYGKEGERTAPNRLKSHEKLQKILMDYSGVSNKRIYAMLFEISYSNIYLFDGVSKDFIVDGESENIHYNRIISEFPNYNEVINICEGALINHFKPSYNKNFKNNFPDKNHKGYKDYLNLDYNCLNLELDLDFNDLYVELKTTHESSKGSNYIIKYNLFSNKIRKNMFDSFFDID